MQTGLRARGQCSGSFAAGGRARQRPFSGVAPGSTGAARRHRLAPRADRDREGEPEDLQQKFFARPSEQGQGGQQQQQQRPGSQSRPGSGTATPAEGANLLDSVNPYQLGRQARQVVNELWGQLSAVAAPTKSFAFDDALDMGLDEDAPSSAGRTRVLVVGATGRVGRILSRKLLLRGYKVRALVRRREGMRADAEGVPDAVEVVAGDVGEMRDCQRAVRGVDKIVFVAGARTAFTGDLIRVDDRGVMNLVKAMQDERDRATRVGGKSRNPAAKREVADFNKLYHQLRWDIKFVGSQGDDGSLGRDFQRANLATAEITEENNLLFEGALFTRNAIAEVGTKLNPKLPGGDERFAGCEALTLRAKGEGHTYALVLTTAEGARYVARFPSRLRYATVRLPFSKFRGEKEGQPPLDPESIVGIAIRYELRRSAPQGTAASAMRDQAAAAAAAADRQRINRFKLEVDWIKALPGGVEPDFILLSCSGAPRVGLEEGDLARVVAAKRRGEDHLRASGLGYSIIRPGPLVDEPGGYKALVFDQGDRVTQSVSAADVADICLRALHEPEARNKSFDVCYEYTPDEGLQLYELVASIPGQGSNYLAPALSPLAKNT
ncbi:hypothetical protein Rsub_06470 [Raphidocelis subcapitata]|uniref:NAD(P)-binding domain-containing protein n=1 Tax=Raphidocelis subcapitata TaxID=307507 RepID=A0A2V0P8L0_9CHLO|nr:hypothetical protein Rsub_06470 [Raphidocelis subcapitata]|eukprot:GBF94200.1 hypothetical protein Rsub_06470 [Raphidocelis subcapitata]